MVDFKKSPVEFEYYGAFLQNSEVRKEIHVGNLTYNDGSLVEKYLIPVNEYNIDMKESISVYRI